MPGTAKPDPEAIIVRAVEYHGFDAGLTTMPEVAYEVFQEALGAYVRGRRDRDAALRVLEARLPALADLIETNLQESLTRAIAYNTEKARNSHKPSAEEAIEDLCWDNAIQAYLGGK